jgi:hypothetical protein
MGRPTHVYVVCSPRPQVGKTLVARALIDFYRADGRPVKGFDLDSEESSLTGFVPKFAVRGNVLDVRGQMSLFDQLIIDDERPKVLDLGARDLATFLKVMEETNFPAEARRMSIQLVMLFVASPDQRAVDAYVDLARRFPEVALLPVYNEAFARGQATRQRFPLTGEVSVPLHIPAYSSSLKTIIDAKPFSFSEYKRYPLDVPPFLEAGLNSWMKRVFLQFRELELRFLLERLRSTLFKSETAPE